jgi:hypothetical protein
VGKLVYYVTTNFMIYTRGSLLAFCVQPSNVFLIDHVHFFVILCHPYDKKKLPHIRKHALLMSAFVSNYHCE